MTFLFWSLGLLFISGLLSWGARRSPGWANHLGAGGAILGCAMGMIPSLQFFLIGESEAMNLPFWRLPIGNVTLGMDPLSAFFLLPIFGLSGLSALYGSEYLLAPKERPSIGKFWLFYNLLVASMVLVVTARDAVLFLLAWEMMSLSSFFLVIFESEKETVREAGWTYLIAAHLGTAFVLALFVVLGKNAGTFDFQAFGSLGALAPATAGLLFCFAVIGFGTKAGFMPFHVWLPEAHPAAPSPVSAVMSGVMIKTGIYGLVRVLTFLGPPPVWWAWILIGVGFSSGVLGVLFALAQHDLKRLLAYHSVENIGIIALGLGLGVLGVSTGFPVLAVLGFGGGLLHVVNHAIFKGLLFLGAGAVQHGAGTREIDHLGGLLKRMPWTGAAFLVGAVAISGLPPLNGFISEFLIFLGAFRGGLAAEVSTAVSCLGVILGLALIGGLATACFTKAFGVVFLGEPRSESAAHAHEVGWSMRVPMIFLAASCLAIGLFSTNLLWRLTPLLSSLTGLPNKELLRVTDFASQSLMGVTLILSLLLVIVGLLVVLRKALLSKRTIGETGTWNCGYAQPNPRMQYTASSFAQPVTDLFAAFLRTRHHIAPPQGILPTQKASLATETPDLFFENLYRPVFAGVMRAVARIGGLQHGRVQLYVLYLALTLVVLLIWCLGWQK